MTPDQIQAYAVLAFNVASGLVAVAAAVAAFTPSPKDDGRVALARKLLDALAFNFGHAENAKNPTR